MDTFDAINQRRAVKHFDPDHRFSEEEIRRLMEAAIQSPTSFNMQNWRFVVVTDPRVKQDLKEAAMNQAQVADASLVVVMTADLHAFAQEPRRYWQNAPEPVAEMLVRWMGPFYEGKDALQRDEAMRSIGIAAQTLMLAAKAMGYDSCPMIGFDPVRVGEIVNLPANHVVGMMITIGRRTQDPWPKPGQLPLEEVMVRDRFPS